MGDSKIDLMALDSVGIPSHTEITVIRQRLETQSPAFVFNENCFAMFGFGGTIQSAYVPAHETIFPVPMNPALERTLELVDRFEVMDKNLTGSILIVKDSREVTNADLRDLIHTLHVIPNRRILVSCGTYTLPLITRALSRHFSGEKSKKIIGVTGSWLPLSQEGQDADYNIGGTVTAINAFDKADQKGIVFAGFHGRVVMGKELEELDLHPPGINPRFARAIWIRVSCL